MVVNRGEQMPNGVRLCSCKLAVMWHTHFLWALSLSCQQQAGGAVRPVCGCQLFLFFVWGGTLQLISQSAAGRGDLLFPITILNKHLTGLGAGGQTHFSGPTECDTSVHTKVDVSQKMSAQLGLRDFSNSVKLLLTSARKS